MLTAGEQPPIPGISAQGAAAMQRAWLDLQAELARLSTNSDHRVIEGAGHYIHVDRPETVVDAVRDAVQAVREGGEVRRAEN